jgi:hypothetical protein
MSKTLILVSCAFMALGIGMAQAGPCNTTGNAPTMRDAGAGPTPGNTGRTIGTAGDTAQHPPTGTMNRATGNVAASSQDAQKQMQGQPTDAQQAQGAKPSDQLADKGC